MENTSFDGSRAYGHLLHLAQGIGPRPGGSDSERMAAEYAAGLFRECGLNVEMQEFPVQMHEQLVTELFALGAKTEKINCAAQLFAKDTPEEGLEGDLAFLETAHPQYLDEDVKDKVWLVLGGVPLENYGMAMAMKPRAIIAVENEMGVLPKRTHLRRSYKERYGSVPTVRISFMDGMKLIKEGVSRVRIRTRSSETPATSVNVIGEMQGADEHREIVVVCAHLDTVRHVAGAGDNASGTSILLEIARVLSARKSRRTIRFIGFGSEEIGLRGSVHYATRLFEADRAARNAPGFNPVFDRSEMARHSLCVNLDMHGVILGTNKATCMGPAELIGAVKLLASEIGPAFATIQEGTYSSDGMSLAAAGVPGVAFARVGGSSVVTHSRADTIEYLDARHLEMFGKFIEVFLRRYVADAFVFPFAREIPPAIASEVRKYFEVRMAAGFPPA